MARTRSKADLLTRLAGKRPVSDTYDVVLDPDALEAVHEAQRVVSRSELLASSPEDPALVAAQEALEQAKAEAVDATETLHLSGLPRDVYEALQLAHPPTAEQKARDEAYNVDALMPALLAAVLVEDPDAIVPVDLADLKTLADDGVLPGRVFSTSEAAALIKPWNHGEIVTLWNKAVGVCTKVRNPTLPFASRPTRG